MYFILLIGMALAAHLSITSDDSKMASLQLVRPAAGKDKKMVYRFGIEGEKALITLNGEPLMTYTNNTFEITSGFSTNGGIKITDTKHKFYYQDLVQPILVFFEDFDGPFEGWNDFRISTCGEIQNYFLGGPCQFSNNTVAKTFIGLPDHEQVQINFNFHFIDQWMGEVASLRVDKKIVWQDTYNWCDKVMPWLCYKYGINSCGGETPDQISQYISITIQHVEAGVELEFSTTLGRKDSCQASWGVDNISISVI